MKKIPNVFIHPANKSITLSLKQHKCSLIWLHGLGDRAEGFMSFFTHSNSPLYSGVRIKMIQAPKRKVTINQFAQMNSWYDIKSFKRFTQPEAYVFNLQQLEQSSQILQNHVKQQAQFWMKQDPKSQINPYHRVFVGGFSQGGVTSLHYAMKSSYIPAGVISLSSYMLKSTPLTNYKKFPIYLMHGQDDQVIRQIEAKHSYQRILGQSSIIQYHNLKGLDHTVRLQQLTMMKNWFKQVNQMINVHYNSLKKEVKSQQKN